MNEDERTRALAAAERFADLVVEAERRGIVAQRVKATEIKWLPLKRAVWKARLINSEGVPT